MSVVVWTVLSVMKILPGWSYALPLARLTDTRAYFFICSWVPNRERKSRSLMGNFTYTSSMPVMVTREPEVGVM